MNYYINKKIIQGMRPYQQDYCYTEIINGYVVAIVADGNGERIGGKHLSFDSVHNSMDCLRNLLIDEKILSDTELKEIGMFSAKQAAKQAKIIIKTHNYKTCGSTFSLIIISPTGQVCCVWIGDSPVFLHQNNQLIHLTNPVHTLAQRVIAERKIDPSSIDKNSIMHATLTRAVGAENDTPSNSLYSLILPATIVAGSDGALDPLDNEELCSIITKHTTPSGYVDVQALPEEIIHHALFNCSSDNCSVIAIHVNNRKSTHIRKSTNTHQEVSHV